MQAMLLRLPVLHCGAGMCGASQGSLGFLVSEVPTDSKGAPGAAVVSHTETLLVEPTPPGRPA